MIILSTLSMSSFAQQSRFYGVNYLSNQHYRDLEINGSAHLDNIIVANTTIVRGSAYCRDAICQKLSVKGSIQGHAIMAKHADISGSIECTGGTFDILNVAGSCTLETNNMTSRLFVKGKLDATDLQCPVIEVKTMKIKLSNPLVGMILVTQNELAYCGIFNLWGLLSFGNPLQEPTNIYIDGGSVESITFQELAGRVIITNGCQVSLVHNGTIEAR